MIKDGFLRRNIEPTLLYTNINEHVQILIVSFYVDGMVYTGDFVLDEFKESTMRKI